MICFEDQQAASRSFYLWFFVRSQFFALVVAFALQILLLVGLSILSIHVQQIRLFHFFEQ